MKRVMAIVCAAVVATGLAGCRGQGNAAGEPAPETYPLLKQEGVYTQVNLRPNDKAKLGRLYSTNFLQDGLIPRCTPVMIDEMTRTRVLFTVLSTKKQYEYLFEYDRISGTQFDHLNRIFSTSCDAAKVEAMSEIDRKGIRQAEVLPGMSKDAVILAVGYPPHHATPSLDADRWTYWRSRVNKFVVVFDGGKVDRIID